ncbi:MAG: putative hydroxymethylpyrimidine transporter CytX [Chloroflexi bacterium]|nr:putative hydroxymethylpyrimidine transporter CytX [Chloroflexota bacterium]
MAALSEQIREVGINPVPESHPRMSGWDTGVLWGSLGVSFLVMVVGIFLVPGPLWSGLSLGVALLAILVGAIVGNLLLAIGASIGADVRVPTMVLLRAPLGIRGSYIPTALNVAQLLGWAALEVIVMAQAAEVLVTQVLGGPSLYGLWVALFTALTLAMALAGPIAVTKQYLERFAVWAALATIVWLTVAVLVTYDLGALLARPGSPDMSFLRAVDLVVALPISWFPLVADYSRFARDRRAAFWGTGIGYFIPNVWFYALGATLAVAGSVAFDPVQPVVPLLRAIALFTAGWLALLILLFVETDEAFANVYSTAVSIQNWFPRASQRWLIAGIAVVVLVVALNVTLTQYESFLLLIGAFFVPLLGVLAADYFVLHRQRYETAELYRAGGRYGYLGGFNVEAIAVWLVGFVTYLWLGGLPTNSGELIGQLVGTGPVQIGGVASWLGGTLPSFVVVFVLHAALGRLLLRSPTAVRTEA